VEHEVARIRFCLLFSSSSAGTLFVARSSRIFTISASPLPVSGVTIAVEMTNGPGTARYSMPEPAPYVMPISSRSRWTSRLVKPPPSVLDRTSNAQ
jgi:hypothetical protein